MIRAVLEDGMIRPLEPLPEEWIEGRRLVVGSGPSSDQVGDRLDDWFRELQELGPAIYGPGERERALLAMEEADEAAKARARHEMGLP